MGTWQGLLEVPACSIERENQKAKWRGLRTRIPHLRRWPSGRHHILHRLPHQERGDRDVAAAGPARSPLRYLGIPEGVRSLYAAMASGACTEVSASCSTAPPPRGSQVPLQQHAGPYGSSGRAAVLPGSCHGPKPRVSYVPISPPRSTSCRTRPISIRSTEASSTGSDCAGTRPQRTYQSPTAT